MAAKLTNEPYVHYLFFTLLTSFVKDVFHNVVMINPDRNSVDSRLSLNDMSLHSTKRRGSRLTLPIG